MCEIKARTGELSVFLMTGKLSVCQAELQKNSKEDEYMVRKTRFFFGVFEFVRTQYAEKYAEIC